MATAGCGSVSEDKKVDARLADSPKPVDAPDIDVPINTARCNPDAAFGTPEALDELNTTSLDGAASLTADELTIYFYSNRPGGMGMTDIYVATRPNLSSPFGTPALVAGVNTTAQDEWPSITGDGLHLYIDRYAAGVTSWDIYSTQRSSTSMNFPAPTPVTTINSTGDISDANQFVTANHSAVYFASTRGAATSDIIRATRNVGGTFDAPVAVITAATEEQSAAVTADELTMLYSSDGPNSMGAVDIYIVKRSTTSDGFGQPQQSGLSSGATEFINWLSPDGCNAYFMRGVSGQSYDLFWARRPM